MLKTQLLITLKLWLFKLKMLKYINLKPNNNNRIKEKMEKIYKYCLKLWRMKYNLSSKFTHRGKFIPKH